MLWSPPSTGSEQQLLRESRRRALAVSAGDDDGRRCRRQDAKPRRDITDAVQTAQHATRMLDADALKPCGESR